jgi:hypothetical protein
MGLANTTPYPHQLPIDNGDYHGALQDFVWDSGTTLSSVSPLHPFLAVVFPSHHYEHFGTQPGIDMWKRR